MLWKSIYRKKIVNRDCSSRRPRLKRTTNDRQTLLVTPLAIDLEDKSVLRKRKVGCLSTELSRARGRKKRKTMENNGVDDICAGVCQIEDLPDAVIHRIFAQLHTKDVVRASIVSKGWKSLTDSFPVFDFDERYFQVRGIRGKHNFIEAREVQKNMFNKYVEKSLVSRLEPAACIDKFKLNLRTLDDARWTYMDQWLLAAVKKKVKELEVHVPSKRFYLLPDCVISSSTITSLKLSATLIFKNCINLRNLRILSLKDNVLADPMVGIFAKSCPKIEDLRLVNCNIFSFSISGLLELRRVELHNCKNLVEIEVNAPNLETFCYHAKRKQRCRIHLACENLKHLVLEDRRLTNSTFVDLLSKFQLLETLVLQKCRCLRRLSILSRKLKSLAIIHCKKLKEIIVDAPDIYSFQYNGDGHKKAPFLFMNFSSVREAKFYFVNKKTLCFSARNKDLFENFDESKGVKMIAYSRKDMKIYEVPQVAHLNDNSFDKIELTASSTSVLAIVDKWLRECHGRSLTLICPSGGCGLWQLICKMITNKEENPVCCRYYSKKCWRHYLEDVRISDYDIEFQWNM